MTFRTMLTEHQAGCEGEPDPGADRGRAVDHPSGVPACATADKTMQYLTLRE